MRRMAYKEKQSAMFGKLFREFKTRSQKHSHWANCINNWFSTYNVSS